MDIQTWTFILVGITFALYIGIAIWARAGSTSEFYIAGGGVHPIANGMATAADWMSAASFYFQWQVSFSFIGLRWWCIPNGLDRWLRTTCALSCTLPT